MRFSPRRGSTLEARLAAMEQALMRLGNVPSGIGDLLASGLGGAAGGGLQQIIASGTGGGVTSSSVSGDGGGITTMVTNESLSLLTSASRTADTTSPYQTNLYFSRMLLFVNISDASGGGSIQPQLLIKDSVSGNSATVWTANALQNSNGVYTYLFADAGAGGSFTEETGFGPPATTWAVKIHHTNANPIVYSVSVEMMA